MNTAECSSLVRGRCYTAGDDLTVYQVIPESHWTMKKMDPEAMADWIFETVEPGAAGNPGYFRGQGYTIVIAGENFGCGSKSVEHPMAALRGAGVRMVIAESVSRYSYRNAINLALPVLICPGITKKIRRDDEISADYVTGRIINHTTGEEIRAQGLGDFATEIISAGGLLAFVRADLSRQQETQK